MPIYEYKCANCNEVFDEFQSMGASNDNVKCPKCGALKPERLFSAFASSGLSSGGSVSSASSCSSTGPFT
ncbi:zinc ribbon domain-containing protein [candidate division KSB1 bacterium]|nr:zinc ribbon domain-containing protein [candidate division KSB1 bacterium]